MQANIPLSLWNCRARRAVCRSPRCISRVHVKAVESTLPAHPIRTNVEAGRGVVITSITIRLCMMWCLTDEDCPGLLLLLAEIFSLQGVEHCLAGLGGNSKATCGGEQRAKKAVQFAAPPKCPKRMHVSLFFPDRIHKQRSSRSAHPIVPKYSIGLIPVARICILPNPRTLVRTGVERVSSDSSARSLSRIVIPQVPARKCIDPLYESLCQEQAYAMEPKRRRNSPAWLKRVCRWVSSSRAQGKCRVACDSTECSTDKNFQVRRILIRVPP